MPRPRSVEIYLKEGIAEDDQVFAVWESLRGRGRPQEVFRRALREGLRSLASSGELPRAALEGLDPVLLGAVPPAHALMIATAGQGRREARTAPASAPQPSRGGPGASRPVPQQARQATGNQVVEGIQAAQPKSEPLVRTERISIPAGPGYPSTGGLPAAPQAGPSEVGAPATDGGLRPRLKPLMG